MPPHFGLQGRRAVDRLNGTFRVGDRSCNRVSSPEIHGSATAGFCDRRPVPSSARHGVLLPHATCSASRRAGPIRVRHRCTRVLHIAFTLHPAKPELIIPRAPGPSRQNARRIPQQIAGRLPAYPPGSAIFLTCPPRAPAAPRVACTGPVRNIPARVPFPSGASMRSSADGSAAVIRGSVGKSTRSDIFILTESPVRAIYAFFHTCPGCRAAASAETGRLGLFLRWGARVVKGDGL